MPQLAAALLLPVPGPADPFDRSRPDARKLGQEGHRDSPQMSVEQVGREPIGLCSHAAGVGRCQIELPAAERGGPVLHRCFHK
jgi:hypothetical protein